MTRQGMTKKNRDVEGSRGWRKLINTVVQSKGKRIRNEIRVVFLWGGGWGLHERNIGEVRDSRVGKEGRKWVPHPRICTWPNWLATWIIVLYGRRVREASCRVGKFQCCTSILSSSKYVKVNLRLLFKRYGDSMIARASYVTGGVRRQISRVITVRRKLHHTFGIKYLCVMLHLARGSVISESFKTTPEAHPVFCSKCVPLVISQARGIRYVTLTTHPSSSAEFRNEWSCTSTSPTPSRSRQGQLYPHLFTCRSKLIK